MNGQESGRERIHVACDLAALPPDQKHRKQSLRQWLQSDVQETRELPNGYAFRNSPTPDLILAVAEFVALERVCCPFFDFETKVEHGGGPMWLRITGEQNAKQVIEAELASSPGV